MYLGARHGRSEKTPIEGFGSNPSLRALSMAGLLIVEPIFGALPETTVVWMGAAIGDANSWVELAYVHRLYSTRVSAPMGGGPVGFAAFSAHTLSLACV